MTIEADTDEVHYTTTQEAINYYALYAVAEDAADGLSAGAAPATGDWAGTGNFGFMDVEATLGFSIPAPGFPDGLFRTHMASDQLTAGSAGGTGHLCNVTTGGVGMLTVEILLFDLDAETGDAGLGQTAVEYVVNEQGADAGSWGNRWLAMLGRAVLSSVVAVLPPLTPGDLDGDGDVDLYDFVLFTRALPHAQQPSGVDYEWNAENRLVAVVPRWPAVGDSKVTFAYDYRGRRVLKRVFEWDGSSWSTPVAETKFVYDGWRVIMERNGLASDAVQRKHTWGLDLSGTFEGAGGIGGLLATLDTAETPGTTTDDRTYLYTYDANGNVSELIETTAGPDYGTVAAHYEYTPYGQRFNDPAPGEYDQRFRFSTKWFDDETGLGYWGYRHYSPEWGRWVSRDPIGERGAWNLFEYVRCRPPSAVDAMGLEKVEDCRVHVRLGHFEEVDPLAAGEKECSAWGNFTCFGDSHNRVPCKDEDGRPILDENGEPKLCDRPGLIPGFPEIPEKIGPGKNDREFIANLVIALRKAREEAERLARDCECGCKQIVVLLECDFTPTKYEEDNKRGWYNKWCPTQKVKINDDGTIEPGEEEWRGKWIPVECKKAKK